MAVLSLKFIDFEALIFIFLPVNGFLPSLTFLSVIINVPNPATKTFSPLANSSLKISKVVLNVLFPLILL